MIKLKSQWSYNDWCNDYTCSDCGTGLHRDYSSDAFEIAEEEIEVVDKMIDDEEIIYIKRNRSEIKKIRLKALIFSKKKIKIGYNSMELIKYKYYDACKLLKNEGFKNITLVCKKDVSSHSRYRNNQIEKIIINGEIKFSTFDKVKYDCGIEIIYHKKIEIKIPYNSKYYKNKDINLITNYLKELGFTKIHLKPLNDLSFDIFKEKNKITKILINNKKSFKRNTIFTYDDIVIIEYHSYK